MAEARVALIGVGAMTQRVHLPSLSSFPDVRLVGMCDLDQARLTAVADQYAVEGRYSDYRTMVDELAPDGVYAVGQPHLMYDVWVWCLRNGLNLYVEKPLGLTLHQAEVLTQLAEDAGVTTQVSFQRRTSPLLTRLHRRCTERGPLTHAVCEFFKADQRPFTAARDRMLDDCVHAIDTVRWMCAGEVVEVESHCRRVGVPDINWITATLRFDSGAVGLVTTSWSSGRRVFRVQMHGQGIACDADAEGEAVVHADGERVERTDAVTAAGSEEFHVYGGFRTKNREFVDSLLSGRERTSSPFRDGLRTMRVAEQILAQAVLRGQ